MSCGSKIKLSHDMGFIRDETAIIRPAQQKLWENSLQHWLQTDSPDHIPNMTTLETKNTNT